NFQRKCLGKMGEVARQGRTIVLVSHQMNQMRRLCTRVVWVDGGNLRMDGETQRVVSAYESAMSRNSRDGGDRDRGPATKARFLSWEISNPRASDPFTIADLEPVVITMRVGVHEDLDDAMHGIALHNHEEQLVWAWNSPKLRLAVGEHDFRHTFPMLPIRPG